MKQREIFFIVGFVDFVEGELVEVLEEPGAGERVAVFGAEDVAAGDGQASQLVAAGRGDIVEGHAGAAPGYLALVEEGVSLTFKRYIGERGCA